MLLNDFIKKYTYRLPDETTCGLLLQLKDFDLVEEYLLKPIDKPFMEMIKMTMKMLLENNENCISGYCGKSEILLLFKVSEDDESDVQLIASEFASRASTNLFKLLENYYITFTEKVEKSKEQNELDEDDYESLNMRADEIYKLASSDLVFVGRTFYIPDSKIEAATESFIQRTKIKSIEDWHKACDDYMIDLEENPVDTTGMEEDEITEIEAYKEIYTYDHWANFPEYLRLGSGYKKNLVGTLIEENLQEYLEEGDLD